MKTFFALTTGLFAGVIAGFCMGAYFAEYGHQMEKNAVEEFKREQLKEVSEGEV